MIRLISICKKYKNKTVLSNFNYEFNDTGLYYLTGKSGSGKTTLLNIITKNIKATSGVVEYSNDIDSIYKDSYCAYQDFNLFSKLSVLDNIDLLARIKKIKYDKEYALQVLKELGIIDLKNMKANEISGGERQRLSLAIAIILKTKVLVLDEPTSSLDCTNAKKIIEIIKELSKEKLIIVSTHDLDLINEGDNVIDCEHFEKYSNNLKVNNSFNQIHNRVLLNPINLVISKIRLIRKQYIRFIFETIMLTGAICFLTFLFSLLRLSMHQIEARTIVENNLFILPYGMEKIDSDDEKIDKNLNSKFVFLMPKKLTLEGTDDYTKVMYAVIDETMEDDTISFCFEKPFGKDGDFVESNGSKLRIINSQKYELNQKHPDLFVQGFYWINLKTFVKTSEYGAGNITIDNKLMFYNFDTSLKEGEIKVGRLQAELSKVNIGDKIDNDIIVDLFDDSGNQGPLYYISFEEYVARIKDDTWRGILMYDDIKDQSYCENLLDKLESEGAKYVYINDQYTRLYANEYLGSRTTAATFAPIFYVACCLIAFYMSYTMLKENEHNFDILTLSGVSKHSIIGLCLFDQIEIFLCSLFLCIYPLKRLDKYLVDIGKKEFYGNVAIFNTLFDVKYFLISILLSCGIILLFTIAQILLKRKKNTFIN